MKWARRGKEWVHGPASSPTFLVAPAPNGQWDVFYHGTYICSTKGPGDGKFIAYLLLVYERK